MTTNAVEAWHHLLKTHAGGKEVMETFWTIGDQWAQRALDTEGIECPEPAQFPGPIQSLIVDQLKAAKKANEEGMYWQTLFLKSLFI